MTAVDAVTVVIVFARAPAPGAVKTRLIPLLGPERAAALHARLVEKALETAHDAGFSRIELHGTPGVADPFLKACAGRVGAALVAQAEGDLGARMRSAFKSALARHPRVLLVGSDCPALTADHLRQADRILRDRADAVFVPCEDGGYALIGLQRVDPRLFEGVAWGGAAVMAQTRARLTELGWRWRELDTLWDVDRPEDYARLMSSGLLDEHRPGEASLPRRREKSTHPRKRISSRR